MRKCNEIGRDVTASGGRCHAQSERLAQIASNATPIIEFEGDVRRRLMEINNANVFGMWLLGDTNHRQASKVSQHTRTNTKMWVGWTPETPAFNSKLPHFRPPQIKNNRQFENNRIRSKWQVSFVAIHSWRSFVRDVKADGVITHARSSRPTNILLLHRDYNATTQHDLINRFTKRKV